MNTYKPNEFAKLIGVSVRTLQRWDKEGLLKAFRTPTDRRYYTNQQLNEFTNKDLIVSIKCNTLEEIKQLNDLAKKLNCKIL